MSPKIRWLGERWATVRGNLVRHRRIALRSLGAVALLSSLVLPWIPNRYEATARLYVDTQTALKPLLEGLTVKEDIDLQVRMLGRTLITRPNVARIARDAGLFRGEGEVDRATVSRLLQAIEVKPAGTDNLFEIRYRDRDPARAAAVVRLTLDLFVREGVGGKQRDTLDAGRFIDEQIQAAEIRLSQAEERLKAFKKQHFGLTGVSSQDHFTRMSMLAEEVDRLRAEMGAAVQARNAYQRELHVDADDALTDPSTAPPAVLELQARIEAQTKAIDDLRVRYTEAHPDLANARRGLANLQAELEHRRREFLTKARTPGGQHRASVGNPVYQKLRANLAEAEAQVAGLQAQLSIKQAALQAARDAVGRMPQVEAELAQMNRDYDVVRKNYEALVQRREAATLGAQLDRTSRLAQFRVVEPASVRPTPVFPSRTHLAFIMVAASVAAAVAAAQLVATVRPAVQGLQRLAELTGRPVAGRVTAVLSPSALEQERQDRRRILVTGALLLAIQAAWATWTALRSLPG